jgi:hypothetical protein
MELRHAGWRWTGKGKPEWPWKERALREAAAAFRTALNNDYLSIATLVPIPPSKAKTDALYDDRMTRMLRAISHYN